ncbi:MAG: DUF2155 domain-containing protein [Pseudomonadota bacterium]
MIRALAWALWLGSASAVAQTQIIETPLGDPIIIETEIVPQPLEHIGRQSLRQPIVSQTREAVSSAPAAILRGLDKVSGDAVDLPLEAGESKAFGRLDIALRDCRYPSDNPTGNAYAQLQITERSRNDVVFDGWMVASSPALMALDHPRYDVWVIGCKLNQRTPAVVAGESSPRPLMRP